MWGRRWPTLPHPFSLVPGQPPLQLPVARGRVQARGMWIVLVSALGLSLKGAGLSPPCSSYLSPQLQPREGQRGVWETAQPVSGRNPGP